MSLYSRYSARYRRDVGQMPALCGAQYKCPRTTQLYLGSSDLSRDPAAECILSFLKPVMEYTETWPDCWAIYPDTHCISFHK